MATPACRSLRRYRLSFCLLFLRFQITIHIYLVNINIEFNSGFREVIY